MKPERSAKTIQRKNVQFFVGEKIHREFFQPKKTVDFV